MATQLIPLRHSVVRSGTTRSYAALGLCVASLVLVGVSVAMPWLTVFNGLQPIAGFRLGGGDLAGVAVLSLGLLAVAGRETGAAWLRPVAAAGGLFVVVASLVLARQFADYSAHPGAAAVLLSPRTGSGPLVMAAGGLLLAVAAMLTRTHGRRMSHDLMLRLALAVTLFVAGWMHFLLTPEHLGEATLLGVGFLLSGIAQLVIAGTVMTRPGAWVGQVVTTLNTALIAIWAYAVLVGLPFGSNSGGMPGMTSDRGFSVGAGEPIDLAAIITKAAELVAIMLAILVARRSPVESGDEGARIETSDRS